MVRSGITYRTFSDQLGSPIIVVNTSAGAIAEQLSYDEFGNMLRDTNPGFQPFGFAGGLYDQDTKLVRFGARDYDPSLGRWTAKDPILFAGGDVNFYRYVGNDPVNIVDSVGLQGEKCTCEEKHYPGDTIAGPIIQVAALQGMIEGAAAEVIGQAAATFVEIAGVSELRTVDYTFGLGLLKGSPELQDTSAWEFVQRGMNRLF